MDIEGLLVRLNTHKVRFVVIGASAFPRHGWSRVTKDLDDLRYLTELKKRAEASKKKQRRKK